ncbi:MAG: hypothetical protein CND01_02585 [Marine Group II euryarchaeote MED-G34]|nr:MAG: hypothetical protein CND01_02585 [Marine Group II euryarchaeote MED-G34]RZP09998.1 MAG: hypothetical protein EVA35_02725 [Candidatus Poseidoniales archaeon]
MTSDIEAIFYICGAIIWGLVNYPVPTIIILALFYWFFIKSESDEWQAALGGGHHSKSRKPLDLNRTLAPSYIRAYDRLIEYIQFSGGAIKSREDGRQRLSEIWGVPESDVGRFFDSPYVIKTLGLEEPSKENEIVGDDWWEKGYSGDEGTSDASPKTVVEMDSSPAPSTIEVGSEDACGEAGCSTSVTAFDFRCFTCRKRFCQSHAGSSVHCSNCES